jgi:hypothetical protein
MMTTEIEVLAVAIGSRLLPDTDQWVNRFQVKSTSSSSLYTVAQRRSDMVWGCSCRGWTHYRHCKHLDDVLERLANVPPANPSKRGPYDKVTASVLTSARTAYLELETIKKRVVVPKAKANVLDLD